MYKNCHTIEEVFIQFLKDNHCYNEFLENLRNDSRIFNCINLDDLFIEFEETWINAFDWSNTPEGTEFWINLDYEWSNIVKHW